jgi:ABC-type transport system involved in multi-copper enzyme maturation permease subunit
MSISAPRYVRAPVAHLGRASRALAVLEREFRRRSTVGPLFVVTLAFMYVVIDVTFTVSFASLTGTSVMGAFEGPYGSTFWTLLMLIVAAMVGSGSLADDIGSRSITLYLSRPIHLTDYLLAKSAATGSWILIAAAGPGCVAAGLTAALGMVSASTALSAVGATLAVGIVTAVYFTGITLAFSSLTRRSLYAGVAVFGSVLSVTVSSEVVSGVVGNARVLYADPITSLSSIAQASFGLPSPYPTDPAVSFLLMMMVGLVLGVVAWVRLSRMEVVGE